MKIDPTRLWTRKIMWLSSVRYDVDDAVYWNDNHCGKVVACAEDDGGQYRVTLDLEPEHAAMLLRFGFDGFSIRPPS